MARKLNATQKRKRNIRKRDRRKYVKRYVCNVCKKIKLTELHHWYYSDVYDSRAIIEVCRECHEGLHELTRRKKPKAHRKDRRKNRNRRR